MSHRLTFAFAVMGLALGYGSIAMAQEVATATIVVQVPGDAKLYLNDHLTKQTGPLRTFVTPALERGKEHGYEIKAEIMRQGRSTARTQRITVRPGATARVAFSDLDRATDKSDSKNRVIGKGEHRYECVHGWGRLPDHLRWQTTHGVCVDGAGRSWVGK